MMRATGYRTNVAAGPQQQLQLVQVVTIIELAVIIMHSVVELNTDL